jgi:hypothetical protein
MQVRYVNHKNWMSDWPEIPTGQFSLHVSSTQVYIVILTRGASAAGDKTKVFMLQHRWELFCEWCATGVELSKKKRKNKK